MTVAAGDDENEPATLQLGTIGSWCECHACPTLQEEEQSIFPGWIKQVGDFRERFDIDHDLGGLAVARVWGLAAYHGCVAAAFTMHPGDQVEYITAVNERMTLVFSYATPQHEADHKFCLLRETPEFNRDLIRERQQRILDFTLGLYLQTQSSDQMFDKLVYSAAACTIVEHRNSRLLSLAREALQRLSLAPGADLSEEILKCEMAITAPTIAAKPPAQLGSPGTDIFEQCQVCGSGFEWYSSREAQCAEGHMFSKCPSFARRG
jgi:Putative zinc-finger of transcription factor IIIC complex